MDLTNQIDENKTLLKSMSPDNNIHPILDSQSIKRNEYNRIRLKTTSKDNNKYTSNKLEKSTMKNTGKLINAEKGGLPNISGVTCYINTALQILIVNKGKLGLVIVINEIDIPKNRSRNQTMALKIQNILDGIPEVNILQKDLEDLKRFVEDEYFDGRRGLQCAE